MKWKTHLAGGAVAGAVTLAAALNGDFGLPAPPFYVLPLAAGAAALGSLFPDIDNRKSKAGQAAGLISSIVNYLWGHRTLFHSPVLYFLLFFYARDYIGVFLPVMFGFMAGALSHIALDMMNEKGIPLFYPLPGNYHISKIKSQKNKQDTKEEYIVRMATICVAAVIAGRVVVQQIF